jgi:hypothetical protein
MTALITTLIIMLLITHALATVTSRWFCRLLTASKADLSRLSLCQISRLLMICVTLFGIMTSSQIALGAASPTTSARFAIFIGSNLGLPDEPVLRFAEKDALHVSKVFARFGQVPPQNQMVLLSPEMSDVKQSFQTLRTRIKSLPLTTQATLIFYYSGHADANALHIGPQRLTFDTIKNLLRDTEAPLKLILIDACRSGAFTRLKGARQAPAFKIKTAPLAVKGVAVISSSSPHEDAQESDITRGGIFTQHLVTGLMGAADRSQDQQISLTEIYEYTYRETVKSTSETVTVQHPNYSFSLRGKNEVILTQLAKTKGFSQLNLEASTSINGVYILIPRASDLPLTEVRVESSQDLLIHPGDYLVRYRDHSGLYERAYTFKPHQSYPVRRQDLKQIPYGVSVRRGRMRYSLSDERLSAWALSLDSSMQSPLQAQMANRWGGGIQLERHTPSLSLHLRLSGNYSDPLTSQVADFTQLEGLGEVGIGRFFDLSWLSLTTQLWVGSAWIGQRFNPNSNTTDRSSWAGVISPILGAQFSLGARIFTRLLGGPRLWILPRGSSTTQDERADIRLGWGFTLSLGSYL